MWAFLMRPSNKGINVTGNKVIDCKYHIFGSDLYIQRLKTNCCQLVGRAGRSTKVHHLVPR